MDTRSRSTAGTFGISEIATATDDSAQSPSKRLRNRGRRGNSGNSARPWTHVRGPSSSPSRRRSQFPRFNGVETLPLVEYTEPEPELEPEGDVDAAAPAGTRLFSAVRGFALCALLIPSMHLVLRYSFGDTLGHSGVLFGVLFIFVTDCCLVIDGLLSPWPVAREWWHESGPVLICAVYETFQIVIGLLIDVDRRYFGSESTDKSRILGAFTMNTILGNVLSLLVFAFKAPRGKGWGNVVMFMDFFLNLGIGRMLSMMSFKTADRAPILDTQEARSAMTVTCVLLVLFARRVAGDVLNKFKWTRFSTTIEGKHRELPGDGTASRMALMISVFVNGCRWILPLFWAECPTQALLGKGMAPINAAEDGRITYLMGYMLLMILHTMHAICVDDPEFLKTYNAMRLFVELFSMCVLKSEATAFFSSAEVQRALASAHSGTGDVHWEMHLRHLTDTGCKLAIVAAHVVSLVHDVYFDKIPTHQTSDSHSS